MTPRTPIFVSAVSKELRSARQLVANTLAFLGYQPVWQDIFGTEGGDLRGLLRQQIDQCKGVVQLVGHYYGAEPPTPDETFGRVSYTQYEALYARQRGKKVWYFFIDENFPVDAHVHNDELSELQAAYRNRVQFDSHLFHSLASREALEASVLKLRDDLARLRRGFKQWAWGVALLLCLIAALVVWLVRGQGQASREIGETKKEMIALTAEMKQMRRAITEYPRVDAQVRESRSGKDATTNLERVYTELGKRVGVDPKTLREKLPQLAEQLKRSPEASSYERANAAYVAGDYLEAEQLAMKAADERRKSASTKPLDVVQALTLAGLSAQRRIQYASAMEHFREAERLTDREQSPADWAEVQQEIADLLIDQGQFSDAVNLLHTVVEVRSQSLSPEHLDTLKSRSSLVTALRSHGKFAEAEAESRSVLKLQHKVLGPQHPDTLAGRLNLANTLLDQGKYGEAEAEYRAVLKLEEELFGPEDTDTLASRINLATTMVRQGRYVEAEVEYRAVLTLQEKLLGVEHPETLANRMNLANILLNQGKHAEAEAESRAVLKLQESVLGPEHPQTLTSRMNLANALDSQGKYREAEAENRAVLKLQEKVLGPEHPQTLMNRMNLAITMFRQRKYEQAEAEHREVLKLKENVLGPEHPDTLASRLALANTLDAQGKYDEAEADFRDVLTIQEKLLSPDHPQMLTNRQGLINTLLKQRKFAEAEAETRTMLKILGPDHAEALTNRVVLAITMFRQRKYAEAAVEYRAVLALQQKLLGPDHPDTIESQGALAYCLMTEGNIAEAKLFAQDALEGARKTLGPDHPTTKRYEKLCAELKAKQK